MQSVSAGFLATLAAGVQPIIVKLELLETSGFNWPEDIEATFTCTPGSKASTFDTCDIENLADGLASETAKYLILDQRKANGDPITFGDAYRCSGPNMLTNLGWWSSSQSAANGVFAVHPTARVVYDSVVTCNLIRVTTSQAYGGLKQITLYVWFEGETPGVDPATSLGTFDFTDPDFDGYRVWTPFDVDYTVKRITGIQAEVISTQLGTDFARILEIEPLMEWSTKTLATLEDYLTEEGIQLKKSSGEMQSMNPASPGIGVNECTFTLSYGCPVVPDEGQLVQIHAGFDEDELLTQGLFLISEVVEDVDGYAVTATGFLGLAQDHPYPSTVYQNKTIQQILTDVLTWLGFRESDITFNLTANTTWPWYVIQGKTCDQALADLCEDFQVSIFETELGTATVMSDYSAASVVTLVDDDIADFRKVKPKEINHIAISYGSLSPDKAGRQQIISETVEMTASETGTTVGLRMNRSPVLYPEAPYISNPEDVDVTINWWAADAYYLNINLTNNAAAVASVGIAEFGVPLVLPENELTAEAFNNTSIRRKGLRTYPLSLYAGATAASKALIAQLAQDLLTYMKEAQGTIVLQLNQPAYHLQLRDTVTINATLRSALNGEYVIINIPDVLEEQPKIELLPKAAVT